MKKLDIYNYAGVTKNDNKAILNALKKKIDLTIDEHGKVYSEGGIYIADVIETEAENSIGSM